MRLLVGVKLIEVFEKIKVYKRFDFFDWAIGWCLIVFK